MPEPQQKLTHCERRKKIVQALELMKEIHLDTPRNDSINIARSKVYDTTRYYLDHELKELNNENIFNR